MRLLSALFGITLLLVALDAGAVTVHRPCKELLNPKLWDPPSTQVRGPRPAKPELQLKRERLTALQKQDVLDAELIQPSMARMQALQSEIVSEMSDLQLNIEVQEWMNYFNRQPQGYLPGLMPDWNATSVDALIHEYRAALQSNREGQSQLMNFMRNVQQRAYGYRDLLSMQGSAPQKKLEWFRIWQNSAYPADVLTEFHKRLRLRLSSGAVAP